MILPYMISVVINTYNAERHLAECLEAVKDFDEIVVCDMESTDRTVEIAQRYGCKIVTYPKGDCVSAEPARTFAIQSASSEWVLVVDSDEIITPELRKYLYERTQADDGVKGLYIARLNKIFGVYNRGWSNDYQLRFFIREGTEWPPYVHTFPKVNGRVEKAPRQYKMLHLPASLVAVLPLAVTETCVLQSAVLKLWIVAELWAAAFPLTYHLTYRKISPDYDNQIDPAFAIYLFGILAGLSVLLPSLCVAPLLVLALVAPLFLIGYYLLYHHVIDMNGMLLIRQTNYNEIIEFFRSSPLWKTLAGLVLLSGLVLAFVLIGQPLAVGAASLWSSALIVVLLGAVAHYLFKPRHSLFSRTGLAKLYLDVSEYARSNSRYVQNQQQRMEHLEARALHPLSAPHTFLLVIGESATREYMSAFVPMAEDTTPWMRALSEDSAHCVLFPHAYSCDIQTVPSLEKALTAFNQYDGGQFYTSTSIVDIAKRLGYKVHWYSNQGHLGAADTPVTLVAETSDVAKWTNQQLGKKYYDEALLDFLDEVDPTRNNLVVLHLKGSHFNYENRFPEACRQWGDADNHDLVLNYKNSLHYTDSVLRQAFDTLRAKCHLQGMIYCSDHGVVPNRQRLPNFWGFGYTYIPLMVWMSEEYVARRPDRAKALRANKDKYWTNDLLYDLVCGVLDVASPDYKEENSLASPTYRFERDDLTIMKGTIRIADDQDGAPGSASTN